MINCFLVIPPGSEKWASLELLEKSSVADTSSLSESIRIFPGGVEFQCALEDLGNLHHQLRIPVRILVRIWEGGVHSWEELWAACEKVEWARYLGHECPVEISVSSRSSKLFHKGQLTDRLTRWFQKNLGKSKQGSAQTIHFRLFRDQLTISLDATGEPLYKRGFKKKVGKAPLRENLAALILKIATRGIPSSVLRRCQLIDPFAGSGTLLLESLEGGSFASERRYSFERWPIFKDLVDGRSSLRVRENVDVLFKEYVGIERDPYQFNELTSNVKGIERAGVCVRLHHGDNLDPMLPVDSPLPRVLVANPPFGERIGGGKGGAGVADILNRFEPWRAALLMPRNWNLDRILNRAENYKVLDLLPLSHGGLDVQISLFQKSRSLDLDPTFADVAPD